MYDVITIGSATRDVFIEPAEAEVEESKKYKTGKGLCFSLGSKIDVPRIHYRTGGSAVNAAITFSRQGLKTATLCKVGEDSRGESIKKRLQEEGVSTDFMARDSKHLTAYSIIANAAGQRTIFVHRGASEYLCCEEEVPYKKLQGAKWLYITNLGGESAKIFEPLVDFASKAKVKIALNPGKAQLALEDKMKPVLEKVDLLILNQEEASYLTGGSFEHEDEVFKILDSWVKGIVVVTKGPRGFTACDNEHIWRAGILKEPKFIDRTGAGDAFGSGLVSAIIQGEPLDVALQTGSANATGVLGEWGANRGLLAGGDDIYAFGKLEIEKKKCAL